MKSKTVRLIVGICSVILGALGLIGPISYGPETLVYVFQALMIVIGVALLMPPFQKAMRLLMIIATAIFSLMVVTGLIILFVIPLAGVLIFAMVGIPFAFSILFHVRHHREDKLSKAKSD